MHILLCTLAYALRILAVLSSLLFAVSLVTMLSCPQKQSNPPRQVVPAKGIRNLLAVRVHKPKPAPFVRYSQSPDDMREKARQAANYRDRKGLLSTFRSSTKTTEPKPSPAQLIIDAFYIRRRIALIGAELKNLSPEDLRCECSRGLRAELQSLEEQLSDCLAASAATAMSPEIAKTKRKSAVKNFFRLTKKAHKPSPLGMDSNIALC